MFNEKFVFYLNECFLFVSYHSTCTHRWGHVAVGGGGSDMLPSRIQSKAPVDLVQEALSSLLSTETGLIVIYVSRIASFTIELK